MDRFIAVESFTEQDGTFHPYGHEFTMVESNERAALLAAGTIRVDDRKMKTLKEAEASTERAAKVGPKVERGDETGG